MRYYFAPLEGITDLTYRTLHYKYFSGIDCYFMPFLSPTQNHCLTNKEQRELPNRSTLLCHTVPQILTKSVDDFLWAAQCCKDRGYDEVNLNIGCPSGTVVAKGKGAGMLANPDSLSDFLDKVFQKSPVKISIKTRIGMDSPMEFPKILEIFNQYPLTELIIHPRVRKMFYKDRIELDAFQYAINHSAHPLCYNGDITALDDIAYVTDVFPNVRAIMIGRGLISDPGMLVGSTDRNTLLEFHEELFDEYCCIFGSKQNAMCRMKEIWSMLIRLFGDSHQREKTLKRTNDYDVFRSLTKEILTKLPMTPLQASLLPYSETKL